MKAASDLNDHKEEYPPKSLYAIVCCFKRFFEQNGVHNINPISSTNNAVFGDFRTMLDL